MYDKVFRMQEEVLKTLANRKRLEIVQLLRNDELTVSQMIDMLGISQSNLSQHLSVLRRHKVVETRKVGLRVYYRLSDEHIGAVVKELREFLRSQFAHEPEIKELGRLNDPSLYPIVKDPVCGMRLSEADATNSVVHSGVVYHFCATGCQIKFTDHPHRYVHTTKDKSHAAR